MLDSFRVAQRPSEDFPNKTTAFGAGILNTLTRNTSPGSPLFASLTSAPTFNASILSFQFIPTGSTITLKYVFGSEEYGDVVNTGFPPDVLGVFVNGVNYARVPGASAPVSTASINCGGPTSGAASGVNPQNCSLYRDNPPFFGKIETELDGLTVVLTLTAPVLRWTSQHDPAWHCEFVRFVRRFGSVHTSRKPAIGSVIFRR